MINIKDIRIGEKSSINILLEKDGKILFTSHDYLIERPLNKLIKSLKESKKLCNELICQN